MFPCYAANIINYSVIVYDHNIFFKCFCLLRTKSWTPHHGFSTGVH